MNALQLAGLPPEYGLYCSFVGTTVYPVSSPSTCTVSRFLRPAVPGNLQRHHVRSNRSRLFVSSGSALQHPPKVSRRLDQPSNLCHSRVLMRKPQSSISLVAAGTSLLQGVVIFLLGVLRLGWMVEFIPAPAVGGFVTGSAIQIIASQLPPLLGIKSEGDSSFEIFWNTLRNIRNARVDSALGISGLASLYLLRWVCQVLTRKYPRHGLSSLPLLYPPYSLTGSYSSPGLLLHLRDQERFRGRCPYFHLLDNHHQLQWERTDRGPWRSPSWIQN